jgi:hypothetical protein
MDKWLIMGYGSGAYHPSFLITNEEDGLSWTKQPLEANLFDSYQKAYEVRQMIPRSKWIRNISIVRLADVSGKPS